MNIVSFTNYQQKNNHFNSVYNPALVSFGAKKSLPANEKSVLANGKFVRSDNVLSPMTMYGYGAYTAFKYSPDGILNLNDHLRRLEYNCKQLGFPYASDKTVINAIKKTLEKNACLDKEVSVRVTVYPREVNWNNLLELEKKPCEIMVQILDSCELPKDYKIKSVKLTRHLPDMKTVDRVVNVKAKLEALKSGYNDGMFVNDDGHVTEGTTWNIFFVKDFKVYTPATTDGLLKGTTRTMIANMCKKLNLRLVEEPVPLNSIGNFDSAFITNALIGIKPINKIDNSKYDVNNKVIKELQDEFSKLPLTKL